MATYFAKSSITISPVLIGHIKHLYSMAMDEIARRDGPQSQASALQSKEPHWTPLAILAYILATAAMEAFVNEVFLNGFGQLALGRSPGEASNMMLSGTDKSLEKLDLPTKLIKVSRVIIGRSLDSGKQPHQDMTLLTQLRNELVHYKMEESKEKVSGTVSPSITGSLVDIQYHRSGGNWHLYKNASLWPKEQ